jgi:nucleoside permease NupC
MVPEREEPLTRGEVKLDVEVQDVNVLDAAANGTTVGWHLAINVAAMLISFVALIAMANSIVGWFGGLFRDVAGVLLFDAMALAAAAVFFYCARKGAFRDAWLGGAIAVIALAYLVLRITVGDPVARQVALVAAAAWTAALLTSARKTPYGRYAWMGAIGAALVATLAVVLLGPLPADRTLSVELLLGWAHWPIALIMGVPVADCLTVGRFLGEKLILTEFTAYLNLSGYLGAVGRGEALPLEPRSLVILSYALCGFANFASVGIQVGGISSLAPTRRHDLSRIGISAMIGGAIASLMAACVVGVLV